MLKSLEVITVLALAIHVNETNTGSGVGKWV